MIVYGGACNKKVFLAIKFCNEFCDGAFAE